MNMVKNKNKKKIVRTLEGTVVSSKMGKTVVVAVERFKKHPKYKKRYKVTKRYKAHDEGNKFKEGDKVLIAAVRPLSKEKRWRVAKKINPIRHE